MLKRVQLKANKDFYVNNASNYLHKYRYTLEQIGKPDSIKRLAIEMYLEGLGFRSIERILGVSNVSILNWLKEHQAVKQKSTENLKESLI